MFLLCLRTFKTFWSESTETAAMGKEGKKGRLECVGNEISSRIRRMPERRKTRKVYRLRRFFVLFCQNTFFIAA